jgi:uncharacterized spore protein YtfJ
MDVQRVITTAQEALTARRVFGEAYEKDGVTIIPAATVRGGAGGGGGEGPPGQGSGSGSGFGVSARPMGAFVIEGGSVTWTPAIDRNRLIAAAAAVAIVALLTMRSVARARAKALRLTGG